MGTGFVFITLDYQQFTDFGKRKSQSLSAANELDSLNVVRVEQAKAAFRAWRPLQKPLLFVEPNGIGAQPGLFGYLADLNPAPGHTFPDYTLEWTPESSGTFARYA